MKRTVTISNKHLKRIFYRHNLPETAETSVMNETSEKKWTSSLETTETMKLNGKLMKQTVTLLPGSSRQFWLYFLMLIF